ncbi:hypothetical protein EW146_g671 [Bondarzewia mesenterica]|uniref:3-carboxymuconate cyclase n=1 Tax=Bondarzewia mesenterica TaxID=1095465 RepID=A0A4V3XGB6_9AGAM|nr:hypothetical protein EW146_g671 [Bondarzewia mesenterica]
MKFTTTFCMLSALVTSAVVSGRPLFPRAFGKDKVMNNSTSNGIVGAAYFITNQPEGNFVVSANIGTDGQLTLARAVHAGGRGSHGISVGPDALFSQGAVKASASGKILATVNNNPSEISQLGTPVSSEGEFPVSLAINKAGNQVCVLNGGTVNTVNCYSVDQKLGLVAMNNTLRSLGLNQTTPATGPAGTVSHVIFTEDGKNLVASVKGTPPTPGFLAVFAVAADGSLSEKATQIAPQKGGLLPFSMTVIPGKNAILATDAGVGFDIFDFTDITAASSNSSKSSVVPIDGQGATCWSSFSSKTGNFYLTDVITSIVTEVNVDVNLKGTVVKQYPQGNGTATIDNDIATVGNNDFMYVLQPNATAISVLSLNAPGQAKNIQTLDIAGPASKVGLSISKDNLQGMTTFVKA